MVMLSDVSLLLFKDMGIPDKEITFWASLLILPWSLKPFFSPVMELFGSKRQYVFISEIISALMLGLIAASLGLEESFPLLLLLMAVMALSGSVHDIAGDGIYMEALTPTLQSKFVGWQGAFYNIAKVLAKGGLVYLVGYLTRFHRSCPLLAEYDSGGGCTDAPAWPVAYGGATPQSDSCSG